MYYECLIFILYRTAVTVVLSIMPAGNQPPQFTASNYTIYVSEGVPTGSSLFRIPVSDAENDPLTFSLLSQTPEIAFNTYTESPSGYQILRNSIGLDRERYSSYTLLLRAAQTNNVNSFAECTIFVIVTDVNDNAPRFAQNSYTFSIQENQPTNTPVGTPVTATDADAPNTAFSTITYSIQPSSNDFTINSATGQIASMQSFNYEFRTQYNFTVVATDGGGLVGITTVTVNILDLQDNIPLFDRDRYEFYVDEQRNIGTVVGQFTATDVDQTKNIQYQFGAGGDAASFSVTALNGDLSTAAIFDYNIKNLYNLTITTSDGATQCGVIARACAQVAVIVRVSFFLR
jgi:hypothetical protein